MGCWKETKKRRQMKPLEPSAFKIKTPWIGWRQCRGPRRTYGWWFGDGGKFIDGAQDDDGPIIDNSGNILSR
ncbi:hypothetical protein MAR_010341 [Mya arenaria]|uniref:Uncharacterized protein n=1 Tax=Mya arenaria TaxID=6604 RepID=A0ABY7E1B4_MYAAR|nr:hypothetical protein MAR_010341 [Mya arenaria]